MNIILDIIILAVFIITVVIVTKKGFIRSLVAVVGFVAAIVLSLTFAPPIAEASYTHFIEEAVYNKVHDSVADISNQSEETISSSIENVYSSLPSFISEYAKKSGYSSDEIVSAITFDDFSSAHIASAICDNAIKPSIISILNYILVLVLFIPLIFISRFLAKLIKALIRENILGGLDRVLSIVLGVASGVAFVIVFCIAVSLISNLTNSASLLNAIDSSYIFKAILEHIPFAV